LQRSSVFAMTSLSAYVIGIIDAGAEAPKNSPAQSIYTAAVRRGRDQPTKQDPVNGVYCGRSVVSKATIQGEGASKPSQRYSEASGESIRMTKLIETPARSGELLRARSGDWFQRMQKEAIGIRARPEPASRADR